MTSRLYAILFSFFFAVLGCAPGAQNSDEQVDTDSRAVLRIGTSGDYRPFSDWPTASEGHKSRAGADSLPRGFSIDVATAFAAANGFQVRWVPFRWPSLLHELNDARFDLAISGITVRPERSVVGNFSLPLTTSGAAILVPKSSTIVRREDLDRGPIRLAVNAGGHLERVARKLFPSASIEALTNNNRVLDRLIDAQVDAVVTDTLEAPHWQARSTAPLRMIGPLTTDRKAALFRSDRSELAARFNAWLLDAEASGQLALLRDRHALPPTPTATPDAALLASLDERLGLMQDVAHAKSILEVPVENLTVEARVLDAAWRAVEREAASLGKPAPPRSSVIALFGAQIEAAKWVQADALRRRPWDETVASGESTRPDGSSPNSGNLEAVEAAKTAAREKLENALRPALIRIGDRIAVLVARGGLASERDASEAGYEQTRDALLRHGLPDFELRLIHDAVVGLRQAAASDSIPAGSSAAKSVE